MHAIPDTDFLIQALPLLLHDHDCLVIPELGGFVAHPVPARFDGDKGEWVPPGRNVAFNPKLSVRDGLLEQEIRRATGCTNDAASALIDKEVTDLKFKLAAGGTQEIPGLGRMYLTETGLVGFAPEPRLGERYAPPGLTRIPWADLNAVETEAADDPETGDSQTIAPVETEAAETAEATWAGQLLRVAAALLLPLIVGGSLWWGQSEGAQFEFQPFERTTTTPYLPRLEGEDIRFPDLQLDNPLPFLNAGAPTLEPAANNEALMPIPMPMAVASGCTHHVVAGTFSSMQKAAGLARRFESLGYSTSIVPGPNGHHRVSAGCFNDASQAAAFRRGLQQHHGIEKAWILIL